MWRLEPLEKPHAVATSLVASQRSARRFSSFRLAIARLSRLTIDQSQQGKRLGGHLLRDAFCRLRVAEGVGIVGTYIDAKDERARAYYQCHEFASLPGKPFTLWLPGGALEMLFRVQALKARREKP